jgi:hypothetical protein
MLVFHHKKAETPLFDNISGQPKQADRCLSLFRGLNFLANLG